MYVCPDVCPELCNQYCPEVCLCLPSPVVVLDPSTTFDVDFDLALVFPVDPDTEELPPDALDIYNSIIMKIGRKYVYEFTSDCNERFLLIRGSNSRLKRFAELKEWMLVLDPDSAQRQLMKGDSERNIAPVQIEENYDATPIYPFDYIFARYSQVRDSLFWRPEYTTNVISGSERINMFLELIKADENSNGLGVNLRTLVPQGILKAFFPLHKFSEKQELSSLWMLSVFPWNQPLLMIRNYFGDKISLLIAMYSHFLTWMLFPSLVGIAFQVMSLYFWSWSRHETPVFAYFMSMWFVASVAVWSRKEHLLSVFFGHYRKDNATDETRPQYHGEPSTSYINGTEDLYSSRERQRFLMFISGSISIMVLLILIGASSGIYYLRHLLKGIIIGGYEQWVAAGIAAVFIQFSSPLLAIVAKWITDIENHKTDAELERFFVAKLFAFKFVCTFSTFYYLAFGADFLALVDIPYLREIASCQFDDCMKDLAINLSAVIFVRFCSQFLGWYAVPSFLYSPEPQTHLYKVTPSFLANAHRRSKPTENDLDYSTYDSPYRNRYEPLIITATLEPSVVMEMEADAQFSKPAYSMIFDWNVHMSERVIDVLLGIMFSSALPGVTFALAVTMYFGLRGMSWCLLHKYRRGVPMASRGIGAWGTVLSIACVLATLTNAAMVSFTMKNFSSWSVQNKLLLFIAFQWSILLVHAICVHFAPQPQNSQVESIQRQRAEFLEKKLILKEPDFTMSPFAVIYVNEYPVGTASSSPQVSESNIGTPNSQYWNDK